MKNVLSVAAALIAAALCGCDQALLERLSKDAGKKPAQAPAPRPAPSASDAKPGPKPSAVRLPDGYRGATFRMSPEEVTKRFRRAYSRQEGGVLMFAHHLDPAKGEDLRFYFMGGQLQAIEHVCKMDSPQAATEKAGALMVELEKKYGPPKHLGYWTDGTYDIKVRTQEASAVFRTSFLKLANAAEPAKTGERR